MFAFVPNNAPNQFYILTQEQVKEGLQTDLEHARARKKGKGTVLDETDYMSGVEGDFALRYEDAWGAIPE